MGNGGTTPNPQFLFQIGECSVGEPRSGSETVVSYGFAPQPHKNKIERSDRFYKRFTGGRRQFYRRLPRCNIWDVVSHRLRH